MVDHKIQLHGLRCKANRHILIVFVEFYATKKMRSEAKTGTKKLCRVDEIRIVCLVSSPPLAPGATILAINTQIEERSVHISSGSDG